MASEIQDNSTMSVVAYRLEEMVQKASRLHGVNLPQARQMIARQAKVAPGTIENSERDRLKKPNRNVEKFIYEELVREMQRLEHDMQILRQTGAHLADDRMCELQMHMDAARKIMGGLA